MAWGILEPARDEQTAGTVQRDAIQEYRDSNLKKDVTGKHILEPQPSDDLINDPLVCSPSILTDFDFELTSCRTGRKDVAILSLPF